jgi:hypothetical protein
MKNFTITLTLCLVVTFFASAQTIRRVNNNAGITGLNIYTTVQAAHDAAVAGDIIYLERPSQSNTNYGGLTVTKRVSIIGNGYFLDKIANPPFENQVPFVLTLFFNKGSANSTVTGVYIGSSVAVRDSNITFSRCRINGSISTGTDGSNPTAKGNYLTVSKCLLEGGINGAYDSGNYCTFTNILMVNGSSQALISSFNNSVFSYITYIPVGYAQYGGQIGNVTNSVFTNCTFDWRNYTYGLSNLIYSCSGTNFSNNVSVGYSGLPPGNGNINGASTTNFYANSNPLANYSTIGETVFQPGTGAVGTNVGAFSGPNPYLLSGLPPIPIITNFTTSGVGNSTTPLNVSVTVRGNN